MDRLEQIAGIDAYYYPIEGFDGIGGPLGNILPTLDINQFPVQGATTIAADTIFSNPLIDKLLVLGVDKIAKDKNPLRGEYAHLILMGVKGFLGGMMSLSPSPFWKGMGTGLIGGATNNGISFAEQKFLADTPLPEVGIGDIGIIPHIKYHQVAGDSSEGMDMSDYYQYINGTDIVEADDYSDDDLVAWSDMTL